MIAAVAFTVKVIGPTSLSYSNIYGDFIYGIANLIFVNAIIV